MTYKRLYEDALFKLEHNKITLGEFEEMIKPLEREVEQEPKRGHWIPTYGNVKCSVCGSVKDSREVGRATHYCDFCGAKMESEVDNG